MICPYCKEELMYANVYSECVQKAGIDEEGFIEEYGEAEVLDTIAVECPHCAMNIRGYIIER